MNTDSSYWRTYQDARPPFIGIDWGQADWPSLLAPCGKREEKLRLRVGILPGEEWPTFAYGGSPWVYVMADGGELCADCMNAEEALIHFSRDDDEQWRVVGADTYDEGPALQCANCGAEIESAYGDPDNEGE